MTPSGEPRKKKTKNVGKKPAPLASQASARRIITPKTMVVADPVPQTQNSTSPSEEAVRLGAYLKWVAAGRPEGDGVNFWLEAEKELLQWT